MKRSTLVALASALVGCGGPELLVDTTPPWLIPNGGSAQAGQVEGPTAIPITGLGAIVATREPATVQAVDVAPMTVMDAAALEAIGAPSDEEVDGAPPDQVDGEDGEDDGGVSHGDDEIEGDASGADADPTGDVVEEDDEVAASASPEPPTSAADPSILPVTPALAPAPATRVVAGAGYSLEIPAEWEDLDPTGLGSPLIVSANRSMDPSAGFYVNVIVSAEPWAGDTKTYAVLSLSPIVEGGARVLGAHTEPPSRVDRGHVDVEAFWINVTGTPYVTLQRYLTTGSVGYVVTCAAAADTFEAHRGLCLDVADSFSAGWGR